MGAKISVQDTQATRGCRKSGDGVPEVAVLDPANGDVHHVSII